MMVMLDMHKFMGYISHIMVVDYGQGTNNFAFFSFDIRIDYSFPDKVTNWNAIYWPDIDTPLLSRLETL